MPIAVTLSRQIGSGGGRIALEIAEALGLRVVGSDMIHEAMKAGIPEDVALAAENDQQNLIQKVIDFLRRSPRLPASDALIGDEIRTTYISTGLAQSHSDYYRSILESVIFDLAQNEDILIIGRAGQMMLRGTPNSFHLRVVAPIEKRIPVVAERLNLSEEDALEKIKTTDRTRADFLRRYYDVDIDNANLYDLCINTGTIPHEAAAQLALTAIRTALGVD